MYKTPHFTESDHESILRFITEHPFITLIGNDGLHSVATQVPVLIQEEDGILTLSGHMMRKTDHETAFRKNKEVLVMITGPQCYVSASWYSQRGIGGTWNYMTVHARGTIELYDEAETLQILTRLTHRYEAGQEQPELVENMTNEYLQANVKAITGFKIAIQSHHAIFKLSQNRDDESYKTIVQHLSRMDDQGAQEIVAEMVKRRPQLFDA